MKIVLWDQAAEKIEKLSLDVVKDKNGSFAIAKNISKLDTLSVISDAFSKFQAAVSTA